MNSEQRSALQSALLKFDGLGIECDGMSRVISMYLSHQGISHEIHIGRLQVQEVGTIELHYWVALPDGSICDLRARMWLGKSEKVHHGLFRPSATHKYSKAAKMSSIPYSDLFFTILTMATLEQILHGEPAKT